MLTPRAGCVQQVRGPWYLVAVQSRFEKALAWELHAIDADYYLPLSKRIDKFRRPLVVPLFDGYCFCAGETARLHCLEHRRVLDVAPIALQKRFISELGHIENALHANPSLEVVEIKDIGQRVQIISGPFYGFYGVIEDFHDCKGIHRVYVQIETLGRALRVDVDRSCLEPVQDLPK